MIQNIKKLLLSQLICLVQEGLLEFGDLLTRSCPCTMAHLPHTHTHHLFTHSTPSLLAGRVWTTSSLFALIGVFPRRKVHACSDHMISLILWLPADLLCWSIDYPSGQSSTSDLAQQLSSSLLLCKCVFRC